MRPTYPGLYAKSTAIIKKRVSRWPSAYASGQVVQKYKELVKMKYGPKAKPYKEPRNSPPPPLTHWFDEKWVDILTGKPCGSVKSSSYYPVCRPLQKALRLTPAQILDAVERKQRAKKRTAKYPSYFSKKNLA
jgi:hypothetical protein